MKNKYKISLFIIGLLLVGTITLGTTYSVWLANQEQSDFNTTTLECFKVYFSNGHNYELSKINSVTNEEGEKSTPNTIAVTNICSEEKELQIRLNVLKDNTMDLKSLTIDASGYIEQDTILYNNLENKKTAQEDVSTSKLIGLIKVEPNQTVRTNIKLWFDERKTPIVKEDSIFKARYELIDTASSIKSTFAETLLKNATEIESKPSPDFNTIATSNGGLYVLNENDKKTYYYRGPVDNNYVFFANQLWRIVSIKDNRVKLISEKSIGTTKYSFYANAIDYTGTKLIYNNELIENDITKYLNNWYQNTIVTSKLDGYLEETAHCNDSSNYVKMYHTYFGAYDRLVTTKTPTLTCPETKADFGGSYNMKIGLITADEVALAGGVFNINNQNYYLYNGENYYTMTPLEYYNYQAYLVSVNSFGAMTPTNTTSIIGVRPTIVLNKDVTVSGEGTIGNPYTIDE